MAEGKMEKGKEQWYIVQTYSGKENVVRDYLTQRIVSMNMQDSIFRVIVPEETIQEKKIEKLKDGTTKEVIKEKVVKLYPGYVFIEMIDNEDSWWVVRNTPGVTGFLGSAGKKTRPVPVPEFEMEPILKQCGLIVAPELTYKAGDTVTVTRGNFKDQSGVVVSIDEEKNEVVLAVEMFNREVQITVACDECEAVE